MLLRREIRARRLFAKSPGGIPIRNGLVYSLVLSFGRGTSTNLRILFRIEFKTCSATFLDLQARAATDAAPHGPARNAARRPVRTKTTSSQPDVFHHVQRKWVRSI